MAASGGNQTFGVRHMAPCPGQVLWNRFARNVGTLKQEARHSSGPTSRPDAEIFAELVQQYAATCRHPNLPPFTSHQHNAESIHDSARYPEVLRPGVYAHYDHEGTLIYVGESGNPLNRNWKHHRDALAGGRRPPPRIDLITIAEPWERFSLEKFLQCKFLNYQGRWMPGCSGSASPGAKARSRIGRSWSVG